MGEGLSAGDTITISVNNTELEGYVFDGRIKVIALVLAYDDDDNDTQKKKKNKKQQSLIIGTQITILQSWHQQ
mgnify:CR=1 FL=1